MHKTFVCYDENRICIITITLEGEFLTEKEELIQYLLKKAFLKLVVVTMLPGHANKKNQNVKKEKSDSSK